MSWYVDYYLGYKTKENKIHPLAPFDCWGHLKPILTRSGSFSSDLWKRFNRITLDETTEGIIKYFPKGDEYIHIDNKEQPPWCFWISIDELPSGSYFKKGYFLQEDISQYERSLVNDNVYFDGFYHMLTPAEYARKMESELKFGIPNPKKDIEDNEFEVYSCGEYAFYIYPDYESIEYESSVLRNFASEYEYNSNLPKESELVILQTNG